MKFLLLILIVFLSFNSCMTPKQSYEYNKYKDWAYLDSLKIDDLAKKYNDALEQAYQFNQKNKLLDSLLKVCENKNQK